MKVRWLIRADSGVQVGNGHVMRCLVLAEALRERGHEVLFVQRDLPGNLAAYLIGKGFLCALLPASINERHRDLVRADAEATRAAAIACFGGDADGVVVDHYELDRRWHKLFFARAYRILAIDDLANRPLLAHWLLDQTLGRVAADYGERVPVDCHLLLGTKYCLLRPEFRLDAAAVLGLRQRQIAELNPAGAPARWRVLVSLGGTDPSNQTALVLESLERVPGIGEITVVMGWHAPHLADIRAYAARDSRIRVLVGVENMAELLLQHHLAIGAGGTSAWERCAAGLPCITLILADNQRQVAANLLRANAIQYWAEVTDAAELTACFARYREPTFYLAQVSQCLQLCDGLGAARVTEALLAEPMEGVSL